MDITSLINIITSMHLFSKSRARIGFSSVSARPASHAARQPWADIHGMKQKAWIKTKTPVVSFCHQHIIRLFFFLIDLMLLITFQSPYKMHFPDDIKHPLQQQFSVSFLVLWVHMHSKSSPGGLWVIKYRFLGGYYRMMCVTVLFMDIIWQSQQEEPV